MTAYSLWAEKTGALVPTGETTAAMERGTELEPLAVKRLARLWPDCKVWQPNTYYRDPILRIGATPDCFVQCPGDELGNVQIKSVESMLFRQNWLQEDGSVVPPMYAAIQTIIEAHLSGAKRASVAALVISHGIELHVVDVPIHDGIIERVRAEVAAFWRMVDEGRTPDPDYARDAGLIETLYAPSQEQILDLSRVNHLPELLDQRAELGDRRKHDEARLREIKAELLDLLGDHSLARLADGRMLSAKRVQRAAYTVAASEYVDLRIKKGLAT
jgi:predicted phage-related endonuclease